MRTEPDHGEEGLKHQLLSLVPKVLRCHLNIWMCLVIFPLTLKTFPLARDGGQGPLKAGCGRNYFIM